MSTPNATVASKDLARALDLLDGLHTILLSFHAEQRGKDEYDALIRQLEKLDGIEMTWDALRYQPSVGQGWTHLADSVRELRERLLAGYADAAL